MAVAAYHVLGDAITTETQLNPAGTGIRDVHVVPYMIDSGPAKGLQRSVKVPDTAYTADTVKAAIEADLATTHAIANISAK
jgi:hypothetical protein